MPPANPADLQQWQDSTGAVLASVSAIGVIANKYGLACGLPDTTGYGSSYGRGVLVGCHVGDSPGANVANGLSVDVNGNVRGRRIELTLNDSYLTGITIKGAAGQVADLQQWHNSSGAILGTVGPIGNLGIGASAYDAYSAFIYAISTNRVGLVVRGRPSQTQDLQQWQDGTGSVRLAITTDGDRPVLQIGTTASQQGLSIRNNGGTEIIRFQDNGGVNANGYYTNSGMAVVGLSITRGNASQGIYLGGGGEPSVRIESPPITYTTTLAVKGRPVADGRFTAVAVLDGGKSLPVWRVMAA